MFIALRLKVLWSDAASDTPRSLKIEDTNPSV
jgi:hypothetical protein